MRLKLTEDGSEAQVGRLPGRASLLASTEPTGRAEEVRSPWAWTQHRMGGQ